MRTAVTLENRKINTCKENVKENWLLHGTRGRFVVRSVITAGLLYQHCNYVIEMFVIVREEKAAAKSHPVFYILPRI